MLFIVATNVIAIRMPELQPTWTTTAHANEKLANFAFYSI